VTEHQDRREGDSAMYQMLGEIQGTLTGMKEQQDNTLEYVKAVSARVKALELFRNWVMGAAAAMGAVIAWLFK
jgi:hypothetical protein